MHRFARELRSMGYERTERESPFAEGGTLWTNSFELVCDKTAIIIRKDGSQDQIDDDPDEWPDGDRHTYEHSNNTKAAGGYLGTYQWHATDDEQPLTYSDEK